jgi:hypothetical protein
MKPNVGTADRIMRIAIGPGLIAASVLGTIGKANHGRGPSLTQAAHAIAGFEEFSQVTPN